MRIMTVAVFIALLFAQGLPAAAKNKKKQSNRGMLEKMEAVPCGAKERGLAGLGSVFGSVGITHVNSNEKLCPEYLLRTDEMEYHIRPMDGKHPVFLSVGHEGVFKIKKDHMLLKVPDGDHKTRSYQVVGAEPVSAGDSSSAYHSSDESIAPQSKVPAQSSETQKTPVNGAGTPNTPASGAETTMNPVQR